MVHNKIEDFESIAVSCVIWVTGRKYVVGRVKEEK